MAGSASLGKKAAMLFAVDVSLNQSPCNLKLVTVSGTTRHLDATFAIRSCQGRIHVRFSGRSPDQIKVRFVDPECHVASSSDRSTVVPDTILARLRTGNFKCQVPDGHVCDWIWQVPVTRDAWNNEASHFSDED